MYNKKRQARLLADPDMEKAWAAIACIASGTARDWVSIDEVGDFLLKRQVDATAVRFDDRDHSTRYALRPGVTRFPKGWDLHVIAAALAKCTARSIVDHERREDGNFFRAVRKEDHDAWTVVNKDVPIDMRWFTP